jgi:hypothetical protein
MKRGIYITCAECGRQKKPRGRSAPLDMRMCEMDTCDGYMASPLVGDLWPGETDEDFGYPCSDLGTESVSRFGDEAV